jgi:hypothetical protein
MDQQSNAPHVSSFEVIRRETEEGCLCYSIKCVGLLGQELSFLLDYHPCHWMLSCSTAGVSYDWSTQLRLEEGGKK